jgi:hypothetical protein
MSPRILQYYNVYRSQRIRPHVFLLSISFICGLSGCFSPLALDHIAIAYNESVSDVLSKQLLLNIARSRFNQPIFFSGISNIAATLNFQATAGVTPALTGNNGASLMPIFGGAVSENPTISIVPIEGEEFTQRMLKPLSEDKLVLLLRQNLDVDLLLRLVTLEFRNQNDADVYHNRPRNQEDYQAFRRIALHLSSIQDQDALYAEPLIFERSWTLPATSDMGKTFQALEHEYEIKYDPLSAEYQLSKQVTGRTVITNYDPARLSNAERIALNDEAEKNAHNELMVDIRPGFPGGEFALHGKFRLRSFSNIMYFIGRAISAEPERDVSPDSRTTVVTENPASVIAIAETESAPGDTNLYVKHQDKYYFVQNDPLSTWNQTAFRVLSQIYQMTVTDLPKAGTPSITISK